jgi:hypothetical protein
MNYEISHDTNGNKICKVRPSKGRAFSIQTLGNLPKTHKRGVCEHTEAEVRAYVEKYGTEKQKAALRF